MKYIVDIKGEIEGDYEIIGKYEEKTQSEWIPISDGFPNSSDRFLVTTRYGEVMTDFYTGEHFLQGDSIIAWQPLTEPYRAEVIGHWKEHYYPHFDVPGIECSICGAVVESWVSYMPKPDTCPNCHSKMKVDL